MSDESQVDSFVKFSECEGHNFVEFSVTSCLEHMSKLLTNFEWECHGFLIKRLTLSISQLFTFSLGICFCLNL